MKNFLRSGRGMLLQARRGSYFLPVKKYAKTSSLKPFDTMVVRHTAVVKSFVGDIFRRCTALHRRFEWLLSAIGHKPLACIILFCVLFSWLSVSPVFGQEADGHNKIVPLKIGDVVPDELWDYKMPLYEKGSITDSISLADFADGKEVLIIDFWPYWCAPCIKSVLHLDSITRDRQYERIQFVSINVIDTEQHLTGFMKQTGFKVSTLYDFSFLVNRLLTRYIGYYGTLIIKDRRILGAPHLEMLTVQNLDKMEQGRWDELTITYWPELKEIEFAKDLGKGGRL